MVACPVPNDAYLDLKKAQLKKISFQKRNMDIFFFIFYETTFNLLPAHNWVDSLELKRRKLKPISEIIIIIIIITGPFLVLI